MAAAPSAGPSGALRIDAASVVEFQYSGLQGWFYAPQVRVAETSGTGAVTVTGVEFRVPDHTPWACSTHQRVQAGQARELLPELYGDYPLTFDNSGRRSSGEVSILIRFVADGGRVGTLATRAPITPGGLPTTYSGGSGSLWFCAPAR